MSVLRLANPALLILFIGISSAQEKSFTNSLGMEFVLVPPGEFHMGCSPGDKSCYGNEKPAHKVKITGALCIGKYEVTQDQWRKVMGNNPSYFSESDYGQESRRRPVEQVSWNDVQQFLSKLKVSDNGRNYRLPTEAEWEYAARGGTTDAHVGGSQGTVGWFWANSGGRTHPIGEAQPNAWGLYDMLGNVWEWCQDWYAKNYGKAGNRDPAGPASGHEKVIRGSSWYWSAKCFRVSYRYNYGPDYSDYSGGFRCVFDAPTQ